MAKVPERITKAPFPMEHGQHVAITGATGSGKSAFAKALLDSRPHLILFRTKPDTIKWRMDRRATKLATALKAMADPRVNRLEVEPDYDAQAEVFWEVIQKAYTQGGRTLMFDEGFELKRLHLVEEHERLLTQGRSKGLSVVTGMQRPAWVTRFALSEPAHVVSFHHEGRDARVLREVVGDSHYQAIAGLQRYQFVWSSDLPRRSWVGSLEDLA